MTITMTMTMTLVTVKSRFNPKVSSLKSQVLNVKNKETIIL